MKIGIMSDTHDHMGNIRKAADILQENGIDTVCHAGDFIAPFALLPFKEKGISLYGVFGNNDGEKFGLVKIGGEDVTLRENCLELTLEGKKILVIHEPDLLEPLRKSGHYNLIIHGHTHGAEISKGPTMVINPGEVCGYLSGNGTMVILDLQTMEPELITL